ncbi:hypothetical protein OOK44_35370 [Streptomyces cellulosae]|uniref:Uncharacterized protein n=1 Tax=Streptomyces althioticus TaxID=83380 RepID=A0ABZ1YGT6_9ACTN|nr:hypothetical protein [Streptomyces cellulosae]WTB93283.1 hypothetical protein OIE99_34120 [Streptomyces cellulosae]WTC60675.1 hypothetical protein OH715_35875 [Streptomyces cellulosae]
MAKSSNASPVPSPSAASNAVLPALLTIQQGEAARLLLSHVVSLRLAGADAQLLATVITIRAARGGSGNITGKDLDSLRLGDAHGAVAELTALGWQFAGDLLGVDRETPVAVTVPGLADALPISRTARSRVSGWTTRTLASKMAKKATPSARLAALFLAAHSSNDRYGVLPDGMPEHCRAALPELLATGFLAELADGRYRLDEGARRLSGMHPRSHDSAALVRLRWAAWKDSVSPALRRHAENVERCPLCTLPLEQVASAFTQPAVPMQVPLRVRTAYGAWKDSHPDRGPRALQFAAAFRAQHHHGPSIKQLFEGMDWKIESRELRGFIVQRLITNEWLTNTAPVPWTLRPGKAAQSGGAPAAVLSPGRR